MAKKKPSKTTAPLLSAERSSPKPPAPLSAVAQTSKTPPASASASMPVVPTPHVGFWAALPKSIYAPEFYRTIPQRSFGKAFKYLMGFTAIVVLLYSATLLFAWKGIQKELPQNILGTVQSLYPEELEITIQDGKAYTNVNEPYFIDFPATWGDEFTEEYAHLMVIDTQTPFTLDQLQTYQSLIWLTEDSIIVVTDTQTEVRSLYEFGDGILTKEKFDEGMEAFAEGLKGMIVPLILIAMVCMWIVLVIARLIYGFVLALLIMFLSGMLKVELDYAQSYKVGLHAMTLSVLIQWALFVLGNWVALPDFPFHFTLIALLVVGFNFFPYRKPQPGA